MRVVLGVITAIVIGCSVGLGAATNTHSEFGGTVGLANPCNSEGVSAAGPIKIVYVEEDDHFVVHLTFKASGTGSQDNDYLFSFVANAQFDEPTGVSGAVSTFDLPIHGEAITKGDAPNFDWDLGIRVFVVDGQAVGAFFIGPSSTTCHG